MCMSHILRDLLSWLHWNLAHVFIIQIYNISDMEATVNLPIRAVAAIFKNGHHATYIAVYLLNYEAYTGKCGVKVYVLGVMI